MISTERPEVESLREQVIRLNALWTRALAELTACRQGKTVAELAAEIEAGLYEKGDKIVRVGERRATAIREGDLF